MSLLCGSIGTVASRYPCRIKMGSRLVLIHWRDSQTQDGLSSLLYTGPRLSSHLRSHPLRLDFPCALFHLTARDNAQHVKTKGSGVFSERSTKAGKSCNHTLVRQPNRCALTLSRRGRSWDWRRFLAPDRRCGRSMTVMRATREFSIVNV